MNGQRGWSLWRLGLIVIGLLTVMFGLLAVGLSFTTGTEDPESVRGGGVIIALLGSLVGGAGLFLRRPRPVASPVLGDSYLPGNADLRADRLRKRRRGALVGARITGALLLLMGTGTLIYSETMAGTVDEYRAARPCTVASVGASDCYSLLPVHITDVSFTDSRSGRIARVTFTVRGERQSVTFRPGNYASVLRTGAPADARLWHSKYTLLEVGGVSFRTSDNPIREQSQWRTLGIVFIAIGVANNVVFIFLLSTGSRKAADERAASERPEL